MGLLVDMLLLQEMRSLPSLCHSVQQGARPLLCCESAGDSLMFVFHAIVGVCSLHAVSVFWVLFTSPNLAG